MPHEQPTRQQDLAHESALQSQPTPAYEPPAPAYEPLAPGDAETRAPGAYEPVPVGDEWLEDPEELPRRPRRRLLTPLPLSLLAVLLLACGFIAGVLVEKGQGSSSASGGAGTGAAAAFAARFRGAGATGGAGASATSSAGGASAAGAAGAFTRPTAGTVAYLQGSTLYVTNSEGNTVKVATSPATSVTKNVKSSVSAVHPGETVTVTGTTGSSGAVSAEAITVGSSGAGGLASFFGGSGRASRAGGTSGGGGEQSLFGG